jgi:hypothetical protein
MEIRQQMVGLALKLVRTRVLVRSLAMFAATHFHPRDCNRFGRQVESIRWMEALPIRTTCIEIRKNTFDLYNYIRRLRESYLRYARRKVVRAGPVRDGQRFLAEVNKLQRTSNVPDSTNGRFGWR